MPKAGSLAEARAALLDGHLDGRLDVAVSGLGLPDGDGSELIGEMRRANPGVLVVVLSAAMGPGHVEEVVKAGAESVLDKVESIPTIAEEVRRLTGRSDASEAVGDGANHIGVPGSALHSCQSFVG